MKRVLFIIIIIISINVFASGGTLKQNSIIECNGEYFGYHGKPLHWHKAKKVKDSWVSDGEVVDTPSCYIKPENIFEDVSFSKCIDGDTAQFIINGKDKIVRFLAINTPEIKTNLKEGEFLGEEASNYTCNELKNAKKITLEYDANSDKEDKYGRVLAFVYVDDELLESKLIVNGYAKVDYIYGEYKHVDLLKEQESIAKNSGVGIWSLNHGDIISESKEEENNLLENIIYLILKIIYLFIIKIFA